MGRPPVISRESLLDAARRVFSAKGFEASTLAGIAAELGVTPAAILRHVGSKEALFRESMLLGPIRLPDFIVALDTIDISIDPRLVLRSLAEQFVPFAMQRISENIAVFVWGNRSGKPPVLPFVLGDRNSPPRQGLRILENYFRRLAKAGRLRIENPKAAALLFMGTIHSYAFFHEVLLSGLRPFPVSLPAYVDSLIDLWSNGALEPAAAPPMKRAPRPSSKSGGPRRGKKS